MKKIKVAFFAEILIEEFDGAARTMFQIIRRIPSEQFEFLFICGNGPAELFGFECFRVPSANIPVNKGYTLALPYFAETELKNKLKAFAPDVVHVATPSLLGYFALDYAAQNNLQVLSIYHTHFIAYIDYYLSKTPFLIDLAKSKLGAMHKSFYNRCELIYVPSHHIADELTEIGIEPERIKLWTRGIDTSLFAPSKRNRGLIRELTGNDNATILFASRLVWEKNLETLIRIYEQCQAENLPFNFIIAGDGAAREVCQKRMPNAVFAGALPHEKLAELYASADIFLFTSVSETYGNVVAEALASGLPCVIANGGGSADLVDEGVSGFKCQPFDEGGYIEKIKMLLNDNELAAQFSAAGRQQSLSMDWKELTNVYFQDLHQLAGVLQS